MDPGLARRGADDRRVRESVVLVTKSLDAGVGIGSDSLKKCG